MREILAFALALATIVAGVVLTRPAPTVKVVPLEQPAPGLSSQDEPL